ncbi:MAG TPA: methyltransferase domain-containing protein [Leptolyngbyaceae cyanobacterium M33_DOE_097]|uniref:Class I SAM-dependent methyltransferase n=1 Tax=Oscillatoriales cyanobacterium SpSt-418 TaxID=2282169 RepID=A0A7C3KEV3_9CYAN|nr:methyltransferase domain-containing protein [Leptolyngbyaceae cyanobacterium M33_DOE_097]
MTKTKSDYVGSSVGGLATRLSMHIRNQMFRDVMRLVQPNSHTKVLDVGVTCDRRIDSNFFERLYPYPEKLIAVGMEDASFLEELYPGVTFCQTDGRSLPFPDKMFDLVVSFAVVEHVGTREQQTAFVKELCRVGKHVFIATPNRWFPVEFHTTLPLVHWLPPKVFRRLLHSLGRDFWAQESNLNLLDCPSLVAMFPAASQLNVYRYRLLGLVSNLMVYATCNV